MRASEDSHILEASPIETLLHYLWVSKFQHLSAIMLSSSLYK